MKIRKWVPEDVPEIYELWQRMVKYYEARGHNAPWFFDPRDHRNVHTCVAIGDDGKIIAVMTGRVTSEMIITTDASAVTPRQMFTAIWELWAATSKMLWDNGIADCHVPIHHSLKTFYRALVKYLHFVPDTRRNLTVDLRKTYAGK